MKKLIALLTMLAMIGCAQSRDEVALYAHDGAQGPAGPQGPAGETGPQGEPGDLSSAVSITQYLSNECVAIADTDVFVKIGPNTRGLYLQDGCPSNSKFAEVSEGESYWVSNRALAVYSEPGISVINF